MASWEVESTLPEDWSAREAVHRKILADSPADTHALVGLARSLEGQSRYDEAQEAARTAIRLDESLAEAHRILGCVELQYGKTDEAERELKRALELDQQDELTYLSLGALLIQRKDYASAITHLQRGLNLSPNSPKLLFNLGLAQLRQGESGMAIECLRRSSDVDPGSVEAAHLAGILLMRRKDYDFARKYLQRAVDAAPLNCDVQYSRRLLEVRQNGARAARDSFLKLAKQQALSRELRGMLFFLAPPLGRPSCALIPLAFLAWFAITLSGSALSMSLMGLFLIWLSFEQIWYGSKTVGGLVLAGGALMVILGLVSYVHQ